MRVLGVFNTRGNDRFLRGTKVIARTQRGLEVAKCLAKPPTTPLSACKAPLADQSSANCPPKTPTSSRTFTQQRTQRV